MEILTVIVWSLVGSVLSLIGGIALIYNKSVRAIAIRFGLPFGAGALLAASFLGILPEAVEMSGVHDAAWFALAGFLAFFVLERLLGWFHHHEEHHHEAAHGTRDNKTHQWLVIIGDTLHNAIDGVAIGAAFLVNPAAGIGTALAVAAHEVPQEIGDFSILLGKGMKPKKVILVNLFSALATVITAVITFALGDAYALNPAPLLAMAAGLFIYIAASDIIPDIHEKPRAEGNIQAAMLLVGVFVLALVLIATPHSHDHELEQSGDATPHHETNNRHHQDDDDGHHHEEADHGHHSEHDLEKQHAE